MRCDVTDVPGLAFDPRRWIGDVPKVGVKPGRGTRQRGRDLGRVERQILAEQVLRASILLIALS
jgi:hypothetical protein